MARIKICGITRPEDAQCAAEAGADAVGMIFYASSPRAVDVRRARDIVQDLPPFITRVGVFVNETAYTVANIADTCGLDVLQLHGEETPEYCNGFAQKVVKVFRIQDTVDLEIMRSYTVDAWHLDTQDTKLYGGTGRSFDWRLAAEAQSVGPIILAGGLTPDNLREALEQAQPYAVDISSGVESEPGIKDHEKIRRIIRIRNDYLQSRPVATT